MRLIDLECCRWFSIYGCLEIFFFNCNRHHSSLLPRNGDGTANIIHSSKGVAQGDPLPMVAYGIGLLTLIKILK